MNAVIYARHKEKQEIEKQIKACEKYSEENGYTIISKYIDVDSREQFYKMIKDSKKKQFQVVVVYSLDRFSRNKLDYINYKTQLKKNEVEIFPIIRNTENDASGILLESIIEGMNEYYSLELGRKIKEGKARKKAEREKLKQLVNEG